MANKVKFGLRNVHIFPITSEDSEKTVYGEMFKMPGAVNLSIKPSGDSNPFYADDIEYYNTYSNNGYEGDMEFAMLTEEFQIKILGMTKDKNGALIEGINDKSHRFAMAYEIQGDEKATRHILYACSAARPDSEANTMEEGKKTPQTDKLNFSCSGAMDTGYVKARVEQGSEAYKTFFEKVYQVVPNAEG
ncbi:MAG: phage tail protein [Finegoldia magna]|jgi:phi13 family phage major tail protein|nr:phage tail protein [Finegoldia magna]